MGNMASIQLAVRSEIDWTCDLTQLVNVEKSFTWVLYSDKYSLCKGPHGMNKCWFQLNKLFNLEATLPDKC